MTRTFAVELTTICMIENQQGEILVQDRRKPDWPGWTFPGGHVEALESLSAAIIREIKEECGLTITPQLRGTAEWLNDKSGMRELAGLFYARTSEEPQAGSGEDALFWIPKEQLTGDKLAGTLGELLPIFFGNDQLGTYFKDNS
ncbi:8-oxo-dGTP diphosphatase [Enterococcus sp. AD013-P3]|uniref:8-oxo-dGTP diphosphatase n=1 Tax=Enterococcus sp. AD013-P3 TaxID=3411036 RepID=UPI003B92FFD9